MTEQERKRFYHCCIKATVKLADMLNSFEAKVERHLPLPADVEPSVCVAASLLMVLLGMLADSDNGRPELLRAASLLGSESHPMREEIRKAMEEVLDQMDIVFTRYLYN